MEYLAQMGPMLALAGLIAGWMAEAISRAGGHGLIPDIAVGLVGSVLAGGIAWGVVSSDAGMLEMLLIGCAGAVLAVIAQRRLWRSTRLEA